MLSSDGDLILYIQNKHDAVTENKPDSPPNKSIYDWVNHSVVMNGLPSYTKPLNFLFCAFQMQFLWGGQNPLTLAETTEGQCIPV